MSNSFDIGSFVDQLAEDYTPQNRSQSIRGFVREYYSNLEKAHEKQVPWKYLAERISSEFGEEFPILKNLKAGTLKQYFYELRAHRQEEERESSRQFLAKSPVDSSEAVPEAQPTDGSSDEQSGDISFAEFSASPSSHTTVSVEAQSLAS